MILDNEFVLQYFTLQDVFCIDVSSIFSIRQFSLVRLVAPCDRARTHTRTLHNTRARPRTEIRFEREKLRSLATRLFRDKETLVPCNLLSCETLCLWQCETWDMVTSESLDVWFSSDLISFPPSCHFLKTKLLIPKVILQDCDLNCVIMQKKLRFNTQICQSCLVEEYELLVV